MLSLAGRIGPGHGCVRNLSPHHAKVTQGAANPRIETAIGEKHNEEILLGIDPDLGSGPACVPVCRGGKQGAERASSLDAQIG